MLEASWALNTLDANEAKTILCGDQGRRGYAGQGRRRPAASTAKSYSKTFVTEPEPESGRRSVLRRRPPAATRRSWRPACGSTHVLDDSKPLVTKPEQAYVVTQILEAIYRSAETNRPVYFENGELKLD